MTHFVPAAEPQLTLDPATICELATRLDDSERERLQIGQFSLEYPAMTVDDAYAIQRAWVGLKQARGRAIIGHKIGLTSRAMQRTSNIDEPDYGALLDDMVFTGEQRIDVARFILPPSGQSVPDFTPRFTSTMPASQSRLWMLPRRWRDGACRTSFPGCSLVSCGGNE